jgi:mono/diheme cytochrome c family protein
LRRMTKSILNVVIFTTAVFWAISVLGQDAAAGRTANDNALAEKGRSVVVNVCVACHTNILRIVQVHKKSPAQWKDTVYSMIGRGAQVMPDEIDAVASFLSAGAVYIQSPTPAASRQGSGTPRNQAAGGEGRQLLEQNCQQCHDLATASTKLRSEEWNGVIEKMVNYGARVSATDKQKLIDYLDGLEK